MKTIDLKGETYVTIKLSDSGLYLGTSGSIVRKSDEVCRLEGVIKAQEAALANWRKGADEDAGKIKRLEDNLRLLGKPVTLQEAVNKINEHLAKGGSFEMTYPAMDSFYGVVGSPVTSIVL